MLAGLARSTSAKTSPVDGLITSMLAPEAQPTATEGAPAVEAADVGVPATTVVGPSSPKAIRGRRYRCCLNHSPAVL